MCPIALSSRWRAATALSPDPRQPQRLPFLFVKMQERSFAVEYRLKVADNSPTILASIDNIDVLSTDVAVYAYKVAECVN
jgi:hypothetical protein